MSGPGHVDYLLALADDALVSAQRCAEWVTRAPEIEEDIALANLGLDLLGQARLLLAHAGTLEGRGRDEDDLAYFREPAEFRNAVLCELPNHDFAFSMARELVFSSYQQALYRRLLDSADPQLAAVAGKAVKEVTYHREHATGWVLRLGDGTAVSHARMQAGLDAVWPYLPELFDDSWIDPGLLAGQVAVAPSGLAAEVYGHLGRVLAAATLTEPVVAPVAAGGRRGRHTADLEALLAEFHSVARAHPGAVW